MREAMMPTYSPPDFVPERGEGSYLIDSEGQRYLDFMAGIAVNAFGHCHPHLAATLKQQVDRLWHTSNVFRIAEGERLAERLVAECFADHVFFANSGAEAMECAIKTARRYQHDRGHTDKKRIITFTGAFHGRTISTVAACKVPAHCEGFFEGDLGFDQVEYGDLDALARTLDERTAAVILEPVQGEGGIRPASAEFLQAIREACDASGSLLIFDEVQCGMGRTGKLFAHQHHNVAPDIMALAKGLGGGFPIGACLATRAAGDCMVFGTHGSTFGGNPMATAVGNAVLDLMLEPGFMDQVNTRGAQLIDGLNGLIREHPKVLDSVRGLGLMIGLKCTVENTAVLMAARERKLLLAKGGDNMVRMLPPLNISSEEADEALSIIADCCQALA